MRNTHLTVGLFVSIALATVVVVTLWLSGRHSGAATVHYSMYFHKDVSGLGMGGPVYFLGVEVGEVTRMEIITGDPVSVRVDIRILASTPVDTGTSASLAFQGITGVAVINLIGDPGMNLPLKKPPGADYPVIEVRDSGLAALLSDAPGLLEKLNALLDEARALIGGDNGEMLSATLRDVASMTAALKTREQDFAQLPGELNQTMKDMRDTLAELQATASDVRPGLAATVSNMEHMSARLSALTQRLDQWSADNSDDMEAFMKQGLGQVPDLVNDTRRLLREAEKLLREIRDDPSRVLYKPADESVPLDP